MSRRFSTRRRPTLELLEDRCVPAITPIAVTTLADVVDANDGVTSLREAILETNGNSRIDRIEFADDLSGTLSNALPVVQPGGTQDVFLEGQSLTLGATNFSDADGDALTFAWDVNNDGDFSDATGQNPTLAWNQLVALGIDNGFRILPVRVRAFDGSGQFTTSDAISVELRNVVPVVDIRGDTSTAAEGTAVNFTSKVTDPSPSETFTFHWQVTKDGEFYSSGFGSGFLFVPDDNGTFVVTLIVSDGDNSAPDSRTVAVTNVAPRAAIAGAPASSPEGTPITLTADSDDPGSADSFTYVWTVTKDGDDYAESSDPNFTFTPDDNGSYVVTLTVTDDDGDQDSDETIIAVSNVAPHNLTIGGPESLVLNQFATFTVTYTDPGMADTATFTATVLGPNGATFATASSLFFGAVQAGSYLILFTVTDNDGGTNIVEKRITVSVAELQPDPFDATKTALVAGGTNGDSSIKFRHTARPGWVKVMVDGVKHGPFEPTGRLMAFGGFGDDQISVDPKLNLPAWLEGGDGDDVLKGGSKADVLLGITGDDRLFGNGGRDVLIGGLNSDILKGGGGNDILIGAATVFDSTPEALFALFREWTSARTYEARVLNLLGDGSGPDFDNRLNGNTFLECFRATGLDDHATDTLAGNTGRDFFFARMEGTMDVLKDRLSNETLEVIVL